MEVIHVPGSQCRYRGDGHGQAAAGQRWESKPVERPRAHRHGARAGAGEGITVEEAARTRTGAGGWSGVWCRVKLREGHDLMSVVCYSDAGCCCLFAEDADSVVWVSHSGLRV